MMRRGNKGDGKDKSTQERGRMIYLNYGIRRDLECDIVCKVHS